jgi:tetratricopeptide (TPR) repeat protein
MNNIYLVYTLYTPSPKHQSCSPEKKNFLHLKTMNMKKMLLSFMAVWVLSFLVPAAIAQKQVSMSEGSMAWTSKSKQAKKMAAIGLYHVLNVEREQAYHDFKAALESDPGFTLPLAFLANLSVGEARKDFAARAQASAMNKTEGERLLASLADDKATPEARRDIWDKLHKMYMNDRVIGHFYAITRATPDEQFAAITEYVQKYPEEPAMYNMLGYYYMNEKKDSVKAKEYFEKYIQLYPEGANPYDSMGEFYLLTGDAANSEKYYKMALEKYPFMVSSVQALQKIEEGKKKTEKSQ